MQLVGTPVWWTGDGDQSVTVQVTHRAGARFAQQLVSETDSQVAVDLVLRAPAGAASGGDDAVTLSTLGARLARPLGRRRFLLVVNGEPVSGVRATGPAGSVGLCSRVVPTEPRVPTHRAEGPVRAGIPEHGRIPRYYAVKAELLELISELGVGAVLPSERELAERFGVSRVTLRQAVGELVLEGRLRRRQGAGTFVAPPKLLQPLSLVSYTEGMRRQGVAPSRTVITVERLAADDGLAADLRIAPGAEVVHVERVLLADGERVGLESTYLPDERFPTLLDVFDPTASLYACLSERLGVRFAEAEERIETVLATPREALLIGTNPALPMLLLHRVSHDTDGRPIERVRSLYRGDRFSFVATLHAQT